MGKKENGILSWELIILPVSLIPRGHSDVKLGLSPIQLLFSCE